MLAGSTPSRLSLAICYCRFLVQLPGLLKVIVVTDVKVHVKGLSVAVSIRSEDIFVEGPIYADGWGGLRCYERLGDAPATDSNPLWCPTMAHGLTPGFCPSATPLTNYEVEPHIPSFLQLLKTGKFFFFLFLFSPFLGNSFRSDLQSLTHVVPQTKEAIATHQLQN